MANVTSRKEYSKEFGRNIYIISVNGKRIGFEFTKVDAMMKIKLIKNRMKDGVWI